MTDKIDVLAVMDDVVKRRAEMLPSGGHDEAGAIPDMSGNPIVAGNLRRHAEAVAARAAIAELIEAGKALQEAMDTPEKGPFDSLTVKQFHEADARHRAALIECGAALTNIGGA